MRKTNLFAFLLLAAAMFLSGNAMAAWTQAKGHAYNQLTVSYFTADEKMSTIDGDTFEIGENHKADSAKFTSTNLTYYGAYGITDKLTASLTVPYKVIDSDDVTQFHSGQTVHGVGDIDFGLRYNLSQNIFGSGALMSVDGKVKIPAAYDCKNPMAYQNLGDCQYDAQVSMVFGRGFGWGYAILDLGYKYRFEYDDFGQVKPSDHYKIRLDAGHGLTSKLSLRGSIDWTKSVDNAEVSDAFMEEAGRLWGGEVGADKDKVIRDSLGYEPDSLVVGVALAYSITPKVQAVVGYETGVFTVLGQHVTQDASVGQTYSVAGVYMF